MLIKKVGASRKITKDFLIVDPMSVLTKMKKEGATEGLVPYRDNIKYDEFMNLQRSHQWFIRMPTKSKIRATLFGFETGFRLGMN